MSKITDDIPACSTLEEITVGEIHRACARPADRVTAAVQDL